MTRSLTITLLCLSLCGCHRENVAVVDPAPAFEPGIYQSISYRCYGLYGYWFNVGSWDDSRFSPIYYTDTGGFMDPGLIPTEEEVATQYILTYYYADKDFPVLALPTPDHKFGCIGD